MCKTEELGENPSDEEPIFASPSMSWQETEDVQVNLQQWVCYPLRNKILCLHLHSTWIAIVSAKNDQQPPFSPAGFGPLYC